MKQGILSFIFSARCTKSRTAVRRDFLPSNFLSVWLIYYCLKNSNFLRDDSKSIFGISLLFTLYLKTYFPFHLRKEKNAKIKFFIELKICIALFLNLVNILIQINLTARRSLSCSLLALCLFTDNLNKSYQLKKEKKIK